MSLPCPSSVLHFFQKKNAGTNVQKCPKHVVFDIDTTPQIKYMYFQDKGYEHYLQPLLKKMLVCINLIKINNRKKKALNQTQMTIIND